MAITDEQHLRLALDGLRMATVNLDALEDEYGAYAVLTAALHDAVQDLVGKQETEG
jgi:hypothetical protein